MAERRKRSQVALRVGNDLLDAVDQIVKSWTDRGDYITRSDVLRVALALGVPQVNDYLTNAARVKKT